MKPWTLVTYIHKYGHMARCLPSKQQPYGEQAAAVNVCFHHEQTSKCACHMSEYRLVTSGAELNLISIIQGD